MLTIEKALSQYTDEVLAGNDDCLDRLVNELAVEDAEEFLESARIIHILYYNKKASTFDSVFKKVNQRKEEIFDAMPRAASFRGKGDDDTKDQIERIFNEEFKSED